MSDFRVLRSDREILEAKLRALTDELATVRAERDAAKRNYFALADAVCRESTSVEDACRQARETRAERDRLMARIEEVCGYTRPGQPLTHAEACAALDKLFDARFASEPTKGTK